ncbi:MAG: nitrous oxidase accessory protein, partial [Myxococcota bacterium]
MIALLAGAALAAEWVVGVDAPSLQAAIDASAPGDTVVLPEGDWPGPARVDHPLTVEGRGGVLIGGVGTTL